MADPKDIVKRMVEEILDIDISGPEAAPEQINETLDTLFLGMFDGEDVPNDLAVRNERVFKALSKDSVDNAKAIRLAVFGGDMFKGDADREIDGLLKQKLEEKKIPPNLRETRSDALLIVDALANIGAIKSYVNSVVLEPSQLITPVASAPAATDSSPKQLVLPDEQPMPQPVNSKGKVEQEVNKFIDTLGQVPEGTEDKFSFAAAVFLGPNGGESISEVNQLIVQASEDERLQALKAEYEADKENFTFSDEDIEKNKAYFDSGIAADPAKLFSVLDKKDLLLSYENHNTPLTFEEQGKIIQKTLNLYAEVLNEKGHNIDRPIDLDDLTTTPGDDGIDGKLGPLTNQSLQEFTQVVNFLMTGKPGDGIYTPEMGANWLADKNLHDIIEVYIGQSPNKDQLEKDIDEARYIIRPNGGQQEITTKMFIAALDAYANPPQEGDPRYEDYVAATTNPNPNGKPFGLSKDRDPNAKVRLVPQSALQTQTIDWLKGNSSLQNSIPNSGPLMDAMVRTYTGLGIDHFDPNFSPAFDDGTLYERPQYQTDPVSGARLLDNDGDPIEFTPAMYLADAMQATIKKASADGWKDGEWSALEVMLLTVAGSIGDMPFGQYADKKQFVDAVKLSLENAAQYKDDPKRAGESFSNTMSLAFGASRPYDATFKTYPAGEVPVSPAILDFKITRNGLAIEDVYGAYMQLNEGQATPQLLFYHNHMVGVDERGALVVHEVPEKAIEALKNNAVSSLDELKELVDEQTFAGFEKAYNVAQRYNIGMNDLAHRAGQNIAFQAAPPGSAWHPGSGSGYIDAVKSANAKIAPKLQALDDAQTKKIVEELARAELEKQFDEDLKNAYLAEIAAQPKDKETKKKIRRFDQYGDKDDSMALKIQRCIADMRKHPEKNQEFVAFHKNYMERKDALDMLDLLILQVYQTPGFGAPGTIVAQKMDEYHQSAEYVVQRDQIIGELGLANVPWIDPRNVDLGGSSGVSETYDINDIINAYNAQTKEKPFFFENETGQIYVFYETKSGIATIEKFDMDAVLAKHQDYLASYNMSGKGPSALSGLMAEKTRLYNEREALLLKRNQEFPTGDPSNREFPTPQARKEAIDTYTAYTKQIKDLARQREGISHQIEMKSQSGANAATLQLQKDFPMLGEMCVQYDMLPQELIKNARAAQVFTGGGGVSQPTGQAAHLAAAGNSSPSGGTYGTYASKYMVGMAGLPQTGAALVQQHVRRPLSFKPAPFPADTGDRTKNYHAIKNFNEQFSDARNNPLRLAGTNEVYVYLDNDYKTLIKMQVEKLEAENTGQSRAAAGELKSILDNAKNSPYVRIDLSEEIADIKRDGYQDLGSHARYPGLWMIARQYQGNGRGSAEDVYKKLFDPAPGQYTPTLTIKSDGTMVSKMVKSDALPQDALMNDRYNDIMTRPSRRKVPYSRRRMNQKANAHRANMRGVRQANELRDKIDENRLKIARMERDTINPILEKIEAREILTSNEQKDLDKYRYLCTRDVKMRKRLMDHAVRETAKAEKRSEKISGIYKERHENAQDVSNLSYGQHTEKINKLAFTTAPSSGGT
jgi:hypothetical protein